MQSALRRGGWSDVDDEDEDEDDDSDDRTAGFMHRRQLNARADLPRTYAFTTTINVRVVNSTTMSTTVAATWRSRFANLGIRIASRTFNCTLIIYHRDERMKMTRPFANFSSLPHRYRGIEKFFSPRHGELLLLLSLALLRALVFCKINFLLRGL